MIFKYNFKLRIIGYLKTIFISSRNYKKRSEDKIPCTLIPGDGVGPELVNSVETIFEAIKVPVKFDRVELSDLKSTSHSLQDAKDAIRRNRVALLGVLESVQKTTAEKLSSINIKLRQDLDLYANVVHAKTIPGIKTRHKNVDVYVVREQTEGEYSSLEQENVKGVIECLKITTRWKSERMAKFAFDFALRHNKNKVTAIHKANIIKLGDGLFLKCCQRVAKMYPQVQFQNMIVDNATMQMVSRPQQFQIVIMQNLYGSILDNICSGITGGAGVTPGASYSADLAVFQPGARHTYADASGKNIANPIAMILCSVNLLRHINLSTFAHSIEKALYEVIRNGKIRTPDIGGASSTIAFTSEIIKNIECVEC